MNYFIVLIYIMISALKCIPVYSSDMTYEVHVLFDGNWRYGTCTLIKGKTNVIVDTMTIDERQVLLEALASHGMAPDDINYVVCTHACSDHTGNNDLFTKTNQVIVGQSVSGAGNRHPFLDGATYQLDGSDLEVIPTPGHTLDSVSVKVSTEVGVVVIAGDLFEKEDDSSTEMWKKESESVEKQEESRKVVMAVADFIVPGHGPIFKVQK